jgi:PPK2 family polyphosphate:nucleotide phosphotransferase
MAKKQPLHPAPGETVHLKDYDPGYTGDFKGNDADIKDKDESVEELENNRRRLEELQEILYAEGKHALLIVLQAMDAGGKDGAIRSVFKGVNPQGIRVTSFKVPTVEELAHDFLWRIHQHVPPRGMIGIFNRSHYEDVLVVRIENLVPEAIWKARYDHINAFERVLTDSGVTILKFFLHISKEEQKERFEERLRQPDKQWKFAKGDLAVRAKWDQYMAAYEDVLTRCNTDQSPWHIVPANKKWYRDIVISRTIIETLEKLDMRYPAPEPGLDQIVIPD